MAKGDHATATRFFEEAAKHPSCRKQAKAQLAFLARSRGDLITARQLESESALLEQDPPWPDPYLDMVVTLQAGNRGAQRRIALLERDGKYAEALEASFEVLALKRTSQALTGVGINLARLRRYQEAIPFLAEAVQVDPNDSNAHYTLALVLFTQWEISVAGGPVGADAASGFRQVIEHSKKTLALKPDHARACLFWGLAHKHLGENAEAIAPLRRGLSVEPQMFDLHLALGQVLAATGDTNGAKASLATAKQLRPADPRPDTELSRIK
jgi:Flp pilus assembly protein TadD